MKRFAIILNDELVHKYESDNQLLFGGPWGAEDAQHVEYNSDWKFIKYINYDLTCIDNQFNTELTPFVVGEIVEDIEMKQQVELNQQLAEAQSYLNKTDWIMAKISEEVLVRSEDIEVLKLKYSVELAEREVKRLFIRNNR